MESRTLILNDKAYNIAKRFVEIVLPAFASLYFGLAAIWNLPAAEQVVGTIAILTTFLGVCLGISSKAYRNSDERFDGDVIVSTTSSGGTLYTLAINGDPDELKEKEELSFKVVVSEIG